MGMQDIDFDEIDRAVSSVTDRKNDPQTNAGAYAETNAEATVDAGPVTDSETAVSPDTSLLSPAVRRSSGRFMDVVHPSSDMRPASSATSVSSFQREEVTQRNEVASRPEPISAASTAFHWPDPIDVVAPASEPDVETSTQEEPAKLFSEPTEYSESVEPSQSTESSESSEPTENMGSLESPFLTDTKVEKRPLGAFSGADADLPLIEDPFPTFTTARPLSEPLTSAEELVEPDKPEEPAAPLVDELVLPEDPLLLEAHAEGDSEALKVESNTVPTDSIDSIESVVVPSPLDAPVGPTSITQQYKEQPSSAEQPSGSIYDAEAYHQPVTKAVKKRSILVIMVWIVALVLIGGGIGAALYFVVLPRLG